MENSDIDDDFTLDGNALHRNKKEKDLRKKEDLLAVLVIMVRVAMRLDDDDDAVVVVVLVAIVLAANIIRVCLEVTSMQNVCKVSISPLIQRTQHRNRRHTNTQMLFSLPSFMNRKPFRRFLILFLVFVLIPFSGRMFYIQKLDFLQHRQRVSLLHHLNKSSSNNATTETTHHPQVEQQQQHQKHEEEEKRLLEGNPSADG